jgi:molybdopterin converting factor small subunit
MPVIWIPPVMRALTDGKDSVQVPGRTVGQALAGLEAIHPGVWDRLCQRDDLRPFIIVMVDGVVSAMGTRQSLLEQSEVRFLPAIDGG